jgi:tetratricopeptide (TPR) repeat protein
LSLGFFIASCKAYELLMKVSKVDDNNAHALLHLAELASHKSSFEEAIKHLRLAHKISNKSVATGSGYDAAAAAAIRHAHAEKRWKVLRHRSRHATAATTTIRATGAATMDPIEQYVRRMGRAVSETAANIHSLMGISQFRSNPSQPEVHS